MINFGTGFNGRGFPDVDEPSMEKMWRRSGINMEMSPCWNWRIDLEIGMSHL
jgi:hypothetical protein